MTVTYFCKSCNREIKKDYTTKPDFSISCPFCGKNASRHFGQVTTTKEDPSVSGAIQMMLYSQRPSK
jgi:DNA-directed RNA polymerase subunit RPC12/RpoP